MQISLRQTGGVLGGERQVNVTENDIHVTGNGVSVSRKLTDDEAATVGHLATELVKGAPSGDYPGDPYASDAMVTEVEIGGEGTDDRRYQVASGGNAPPELWSLVGKLSEVAERSAS